MESFQQFSNSLPPGLQDLLSSLVDLREGSSLVTFAYKCVLMEGMSGLTILIMIFLCMVLSGLWFQLTKKIKQIRRCFSVLEFQGHFNWR